METSAWHVRASSGTLRAAEGVVLPHAWTEEGVVAGPVSNGAQVLHLSVAVCVLNDTYREARRRGVVLRGVAVVVDGAFDEEWRSTGIAYALELDSPAPTEEQDRLIAVVDDVAEVPKALRAGARVVRLD